MKIPGEIVDSCESGIRYCTCIFSDRRVFETSSNIVITDLPEARASINQSCPRVRYFSLGDSLLDTQPLYTMTWYYVNLEREWLIHDFHYTLHVGNSCQQVTSTQDNLEIDDYMGDFTHSKLMASLPNKKEYSGTSVYSASDEHATETFFLRLSLDPCHPRIDISLHESLKSGKSDRPRSASPSHMLKTILYSFTMPVSLSLPTPHLPGIIKSQNPSPAFSPTPSSPLP